MNKTREKKKLVEELTHYLNDLSIDQLYILPKQNSTKNYLANVAAIFKNLDENDYQEFVSLSKKIQPDIGREERKKAAHDIDIFMRRKVAEWKRYDFGNINKDGADNETSSIHIAGDYVGGDKIGRDKNMSALTSNQSSKHLFKRPEIMIPIIIAIISIPWWPNWYRSIVGSPIVTITSNQELASTTPNLLDIYEKAFSYDILADRQVFFRKYIDSKIYGDGTVREISSLNDRYILDINIGSYSVLCPQEKTEDFERLYPLLKGKKVRFYGIFTYSNYFGYDSNALVIDQCSFERK